MDAVRKGREMKGKLTETQAINFLMERKGEVLSATAWEGYLAGGRGCVMADGLTASFLPLSLVAHFETPIRRRLLPLVKSYAPDRQIVVALVVLLDPATILIALGKRTPALSPEKAFLKHVGTPGCPTMQIVLHAPHGEENPSWEV
jgi:hypothetical protein